MTPFNAITEVFNVWHLMVIAVGPFRTLLRWMVRCEPSQQDKVASAPQHGSHVDQRRTRPHMPSLEAVSPQTPGAAPAWALLARTMCCSHEARIHSKHACQNIAQHGEHAGRCSSENSRTGGRLQHQWLPRWCSCHHLALQSDVRASAAAAAVVAQGGAPWQWGAVTASARCTAG
jgi:hypothetical protein